MIESLNAAAAWFLMLVGAITFVIIAIPLSFALAWKIASWRAVGAVSEEAKQLAKEVDPNNKFSAPVSEMMCELALAGIRDLTPDETIQSDPEPICHFDWSIRSEHHRQEHIELILETLAEAGFCTHPFPDIDSYNKPDRWRRETAGVWLNEPKWHIVEFDDEGHRTVKERVDLEIPEEWRPKVELPRRYSEVE